MAWYELNAWNVTDAAAEWTSRLNADIANKLSVLVAEAKTQAAKQFLTAADNLAMANAWANVTNALSSELTLAQQTVGNATIAQKLANAQYALDNVDWLNNYTNTTQSAADNIRALGKSLGAVVAAAEVLWEINDPEVTSFEVGSTALGALAGLATAVALTTAPVWAAVLVGATTAALAKAFWEEYIAPEILSITQESSSLFWDDFGRLVDTIKDTVSSWFTSAQAWVFRRDPLTLDLDSDGLETVALNTTNPILFDHDGDGVKTATGWISPDDGFLVLDRNGNGVIDSGRELFGDATLIPDGQGGQRNAVDGFEALTAQDTNLDGVVNGQDANFSNLRLWRDLNQNGISEAGELTTLVQNNIASINVTKTENNTLLPNGNVIADLGHYTKTDGSSATLGETAQLGDVDLRENTFYSSFTDPVPLTPEAQVLPNMHGSGQVRKWKEVA